MFEIVILSDARKFLKSVYVSDRSHFARIMQAIEGLRSAPFSGKALCYEFKGQYSLRVGIYRIIYEVDRKIVTVYIVGFGHRKDVYF